MLKKFQKLGNMPLIIILVIVIILALILVIIKTTKSKGVNASTNIAQTENEQNIDEEPEEDIGEETYDEELQQQIQEQEIEQKVDTNSNAKYFIRVNYSQNVVTVYEKDSAGAYTKAVKAMVCSTGTATPRNGIYKTTNKYTWRLLVGNVYGQYATRIVGSILFHSVPYTANRKDTLEYWEYDKLGTAASAGCVRLTVQDAKWIYDNCKSGTQVEFYSDSNPGPLGKPSAQKISEQEAVRNWDPTDPDANNPWKTYNPSQEVPETPEVQTPTTPKNPDHQTNPNNPTTPTEPTPSEPNNPSNPTDPSVPDNPDTPPVNPDDENNPPKNPDEETGGDQTGGDEGKGEQPKPDEGNSGQTGGQEEGSEGESQNPKPQEGEVQS